MAPADARIVARPTVDQKPSRQRAAAHAFLLLRLRPGVEEQAGVLIEDAKREGIHVRTLRRAAHDLGVVRGKPGPQDAWWWRIP